MSDDKQTAKLIQVYLAQYWEESWGFHLKALCFEHFELETEVFFYSFCCTLLHMVFGDFYTPRRNNQNSITLDNRINSMVPVHIFSLQERLLSHPHALVHLNGTHVLFNFSTIEPWTNPLSQETQKHSNTFSTSFLANRKLRVNAGLRGRCTNQKP